MWLEHLVCHYYYELKFLRKIRQFWWYHFKLPLLTWGEVFTKIRPFLYIHLKVWSAPIIMTSWNFRKNAAVLLKWCENLNCSFSKIVQILWSRLKISATPIITSWNFCKNISNLMNSFEHLNCPHYHEVSFFQK